MNDIMAHVGHCTLRTYDSACVSIALVLGLKVVI